MKYFTYLVYIVLWEGFIIGGGAYVVFVLDRSPWWLAAALIVATMAYKPQNWIHGESE